MSAALLSDFLCVFLATVFSKSLVFGGFWWLLDAALCGALVAAHGPAAAPALSLRALAAGALGGLLGLVLSYSAELPRLVDPLLMPDHPCAKRRVIPEVALAMAAACGVRGAAAVGRALAGGPGAWAPRHAALLLALAAAVLAVLVPWLLHSACDAYTKRQNLKYLVALAALVLAHPLAEHAAGAALGAWPGGALAPRRHVAAAARVLLAAALYAVFYAYAGHVALGAGPRGRRCALALSVYPYFLAREAPCGGCDDAEAGPWPSPRFPPVLRDRGGGGEGDDACRIYDRIGQRVLAGAFVLLVGGCHVSVQLLAWLLAAAPALDALAALAALAGLWLLGILLVHSTCGWAPLGDALVVVHAAPSLRSACETMARAYRARPRRFAD